MLVSVMVSMLAVLVLVSVLAVFGDIGGAVFDVGVDVGGMVFVLALLVLVG